jgi:hypothetical protein
MDDEMYEKTSVEPETYEKNIVFFMTTDSDVQQLMADVNEKMTKVILEDTKEPIKLSATEI